MAGPYLLQCLAIRAAAICRFSGSRMAASPSKKTAWACMPALPPASPAFCSLPTAGLLPQEGPWAGGPATRLREGLS